MESGEMSDECSTQNTFNISVETVSEWLYSTTDRIIITIVIPIIFSLGVIANLSFLFVILRSPKIRSDTTLYLVHLSVADLLHLSLQATSDIWIYISSPVRFHSPFGNTAGCVSFWTVSNTGFYASITLVTMVTYDRFLALCHPLKRLSLRRRRRIYMVAICWLVGLMFGGSTVPITAILNVQCLRWPDDDAYSTYPLTTADCGAVQPWLRYYIFPLLNIPWLTAMMANMYMYVRIIHALNKRRHMQGRIERNHKALQVRNQMAKMLIVNGLVFFTCQIPYTVFNLSDWICLLAQVPNPLSDEVLPNRVWISYVPVLLNNIVNPLIYGILNTQYRAAFIQTFQCKGQRPAQVSVRSSSDTGGRDNQDSTAETFTNKKTEDTWL